MLHAAEGVAAGDESDHFGLIETHARKCGGMRIKTLEGLGNSWSASGRCIDSSTTKVDSWT